MRDFVKTLIGPLSDAIMGKEGEILLLIAAVLGRGHVLIEDLPGTGKTTLVKVLARALGADFKRIQCTPDLMPSDVTGGAVFDPSTGRFTIHRGPVFANILLADEINRASPRTQSALLEAMEERQVTIDGKTEKLPEFFHVFATQNPIESQGVYPLPEAQMDRFMIRISLGYPDISVEERLLWPERSVNPWENLDPVCSAEELAKSQDKVERVFVERDLMRYCVELVRRTREHEMLRIAASPRGSMALCRLAQALAWMDGRDYVLPDDIQRAWFPVIRHRLVPHSGRSGDILRSVLEGILHAVPVPR